MNAPAVMLVQLTVDELRAIVREAVRTELGHKGADAAPVKLLSKSELAAVLGCSVATIDRDESIPFVRVGEAKRYELARVLEALAAKRRTTAPEPEQVPAVRLLTRGARR